TLFDEVWLVPKTDQYDLAVLEEIDPRIKLKRFSTGTQNLTDVIETVHMYNKDAKIRSRIYFLTMSSVVKTLESNETWNKAYFVVILNTEEKLNIKKPHMLIN